jgi:hypothetical protein
MEARDDAAVKYCNDCLPLLYLNTSHPVSLLSLPIDLATRTP